MATPTLAERIAKLERLIDSGATSVDVDGVSTRFDIPAARIRLAELRAEQEASRRPALVRITMGDG